MFLPFDGAVPQLNVVVFGEDDVVLGSALQLILIPQLVYLILGKLQLLPQGSNGAFVNFGLFVHYLLDGLAVRSE